MADFLGHSNDLIILSLFLSQVPTYNSISFMYRPRGRVNIRLSLQSCKGGRMITISPNIQGYPRFNIC